jgi:hypothetical protein
MKQITCPHCGDTYPDFDVAHMCSKGPYAPRLKPKMNERIKELAIEAGGGPSKWYTDPEVLEYFAELMVQEVTNIVLHYTDVDEGVSVAKKHFGVE